MSAEAIHHHHESEDAHAHVAHQFVERAQQDESYIVGMWTFLVTEIMFFGALFLAYVVYRSQYPSEIAAASRELSVDLGFVNTLILLTSSLTMALGVRAAMLKSKSGQLFWIGLTILCAFGFMVVKTFEYKRKFDHHLVPGPSFVWPPAHEGHGGGEAHGGEGTASGAETGAHAGAAETAEPPTALTASSHSPSTGAFGTDTAKARAQLYIGLYFIMTGLHGFHVLIGILILGAMWIMIKYKHNAVQDYMPIELAGLYWHFVDIVWIFLYPLLYLIHPKPLF